MQRRTRREPSKQVMVDARLSAISRARKPAMVAPPDEDEQEMDYCKDMSPLVDDSPVLSGLPTGAHPRGQEVPWDFEAQLAEEEN